MSWQSLMDWSRVVRMRGMDPIAAAPIYPAAISSEELTAQTRSAVRRPRR